MNKELVIEKAKEIKDIQTKIEYLKLRKKELEAEIKDEAEQLEQKQNELKRYMLESKKRELDLGVFKAYIKNTTAIDTTEFIEDAKQKIAVITEVNDPLLQELIELGALKIKTEITPDKNMLKTLQPIKQIPLVRIELRNYVEIK